MKKTCLYFRDKIKKWTEQGQEIVEVEKLMSPRPTKVVNLVIANENGDTIAINNTNLISDLLLQVSVPVFLCIIASGAPPSLPPIDPTPYEAASMKEIPKPSTDFFSIRDGIKNKLDSAIRDIFRSKSIFFKKITSLSRFNSLESFNKLFSSSPSPIEIYFKLGNIGFKS